MKRALTKAFSEGVDGANANLFCLVRVALGNRLRSGELKRTEKITLEELWNLLVDVERKQEKDIDKYLNSEQ